MNRTETYRLFVAIDLPDSVKEKIAELTTELSHLRIVNPTQLHLTLRFIGEVDEQAMEAIKTSLATVSSPPLNLHLSGVGCFPGTSRPRVLWIGIPPDPLLLQLQEKIEISVQAAGIPTESRHFVPHITVARPKDSGQKEAARFAKRHASFATDDFVADTFILYRSNFSGQGVSHSIISRYRLSLPPA